MTIVNARPDVLSSFADIPDEIRRRLATGERVALILLDALGRQLLCRHDDHPFVRRLQITPLRTQFPSTTTAHVTTVHFGVPVHEHGLYEWNILEPSLDRLICPLRFNFAGSDVPQELVGTLDPAVLAPGPTVYETLGVPSLVLHPRPIAGSAYSRLATRGATVDSFDRLAEGAAKLVSALRAANGPAYAFLYWDAVDRVGHEHGPDSPQFHAAARSALDALETKLNGLRDTTVLLCADHGQLDVSPERVDYLDVLWPELPSLLSHRRPAGSSRDAFLHVRAEHVEGVVAGLAERLEDRARVLSAAELFDPIGPRLRERLGQVAVLPGPGRQVWLRSAAANERWFRGQHGGLDPAETGTYLAELRRA
ncbi:MAG: alkaline phosphatase family protein [Solirubrobacteraceae bacterium]